MWILIPLILIYPMCSIYNGRTLSQEIIDTKTIHFTFNSKNVKDSFDIYISLPDNYEQTDSGFHTVYYMDANLKSGKATRTAILGFRQRHQAINAIFVGIGHFRNYRELRRRDMITPSVPSATDDSLMADSKYYGHSEEFYQFIQSELIPYIESNYRCKKERSWMGHSLGGLFAFYCLFKKEPIFKNYAALSPALWINESNIYHFEKNYSRYSERLDHTVYLCVGGKETMNKILNCSRRMRDTLELRQYKGLNFIYREFEGESHNSEVPLALEMILPKLPNQ
jgi:predicted alpha/beta superfamily hydrolase